MSVFLKCFQRSFEWIPNASQNSFQFSHHFLHWDLLKASLRWINKLSMKSKCFARERERGRPKMVFAFLSLLIPSESGPLTKTFSDETTNWFRQILADISLKYWPEHLVMRRQIVSSNIGKAEVLLWHLCSCRKRFPNSRSDLIKYWDPWKMAKQMLHLGGKTCPVSEE